MHKYFTLSMLTIAGLVAQCWALDAQATSTSVSPTSTTLHVAVTDSQQVSGVRTFDVGVTQTDDGLFCTKITQVQILDKAKSVTLGSKVLARSLCNFNPTDATVTVAPWSDASLVGACNGKAGQTVPLTMVMDTCTMSSNLSVSIGALFGGQHSDCGKADLSATVLVQCAAIPSAATSVSGPSMVSVATPPSVSTSTSASTTAQTSNTSSTRVTPNASLNAGKGGALAGKFAVGAQTMTFDADVLAHLMMTAQTQSMNDVSADYVALSSAHATYMAASQAFQAKRSACVKQTYTGAQQLAACSPADSIVVCAEKLLTICDGTELKALNTSRLAVNTTAAKLAKDAQALSNATATVP